MKALGLELWGVEFRMLGKCMSLLKCRNTEPVLSNVSDWTYRRLSQWDVACPGIWVGHNQRHVIMT